MFFESNEPYPYIIVLHER